MSAAPNTYRAGPDADGHFGIYGGRYVAETLMPLLLRVESAWEAARKDPGFRAEFEDLLKHYVGRPSPLYFASRITAHCGGAKIYFKRDELNHTGAHKINNTLGQALVDAGAWAKSGSSPRPEAGQHGVATATACARMFGLPCTVYMGADRRPSVRSPERVQHEVAGGSTSVPVESGSAYVASDAINEAMRDWIE